MVREDQIYVQTTSCPSFSPSRIYTRFEPSTLSYHDGINRLKIKKLKLKKKKSAHGPTIEQTKQRNEYLLLA